MSAKSVTILCLGCVVEVSLSGNRVFRGMSVMVVEVVVVVLL